MIPQMTLVFFVLPHIFLLLLLLLFLSQFNPLTPRSFLSMYPIILPLGILYFPLISYLIHNFCGHMNYSMSLVSLVSPGLLS